MDVDIYIVSRARPCLPASASSARPIPSFLRRPRFRRAVNWFADSPARWPAGSSVRPQPSFWRAIIQFADSPARWSVGLPVPVACQAELDLSPAARHALGSKLGIGTASSRRR